MSGGATAEQRFAFHATGLLSAAADVHAQQSSRALVHFRNTITDSENECRVGTPSIDNPVRGETKTSCTVNR